MSPRNEPGDYAEPGEGFGGSRSNDQLGKSCSDPHGQILTPLETNSKATVICINIDSHSLRRLKQKQRCSRDPSLCAKNSTEKRNGRCCFHN